LHPYNFNTENFQLTMRLKGGCHMKRREFLAKLVRYGLTTGALSALPVERLLAQEFNPRLKVPIIDAHAHLPGYSWDEEHTFDAIRRAKLCAISMAVMGDDFSVTGTDSAHSAYIKALESIEIVRQWEAQKLIKIVRRPSDIPLQPNPAAPLAVILSIEAGDAIGTDLNRLNEFYRLGVRMITLVHGTVNRSGNNQIGNDMRRFSSNDPADGGLTDFGYQVVERMNRLGMVVDAAHASTQTLFDIASCTRAPIIDSHTSPCLPSMTSRGPSRLRLYEEMAAVVETGGVVCTWPCGFDGATFHRLTFADWVDEIKAFKSHFGIRFIGLGTDSGGGLPEYVDGWQDVSSVGLLQDAMRSGGLGLLEISAFMSLNFLRVFTRCHAVARVLGYWNT
jgi:microsomal dipeptidase-like Zn-dependent dipeptidase